MSHLWWNLSKEFLLTYPLLLNCSTLSQCCHAAVALLYPFVWQHTYIPVLPPAMLDIVCTPTPFIVGLLSSSLPQLTQLPLEEVRDLFLICNDVSNPPYYVGIACNFTLFLAQVLVVDLENSCLLRQVSQQHQLSFFNSISLSFKYLILFATLLAHSLMTRTPSLLSFSWLLKLCWRGGGS